jgi:hypothetical protein
MVTASAIPLARCRRGSVGAISQYYLGVKLELTSPTIRIIGSRPLFASAPDRHADALNGVRTGGGVSGRIQILESETVVRAQGAEERLDGFTRAYRPHAQP